MPPTRPRSPRSRADEALPTELNFDEDRAAPPDTEDGMHGRSGRGRADISIPGMDGSSNTVDNTPTADELEPETMIDENGGGVPLIDNDAADALLSDVEEDDIGAGDGLDEAELAIAEGGGPDGTEDADEPVQDEDDETIT